MFLKLRIELQKKKLNIMIEKNKKYNKILKQSQKVDKLIIKIMK